MYYPVYGIICDLVVDGENKRDNNKQKSHGVHMYGVHVVWSKQNVCSQDTLKNDFTAPKTIVLRFGLKNDFVVPKTTSNQA